MLSALYVYTSDHTPFTSSILITKYANHVLHASSNYELVENAALQLLTSIVFIIIIRLEIYNLVAFVGMHSITGCPISFEFMNYTIITSHCKGPEYPADKCCKAFKDFACPYADVLNDPNNDCAYTMFSYINLYGHYPPGLFASKCREGKKGVTCPASAAAASADDNGAHTWVQKLPFLPFYQNAGFRKINNDVVICEMCAILLERWFEEDEWWCDVRNVCYCARMLDWGR